MLRLIFTTFVLFYGATIQVAAEDIVINYAHPKYEHLDAEGRKLLSEYAKTYPKIRDFYLNIRADVTVKIINTLSENNLRTLKSSWKSQGLSENEINNLIEHSIRPEWQYEVRYRYSDRYSRVDKKMNHLITPSIRAKLPPDISQQDFIPEVEVTLFTPTMGYQLSRSNPLNKYFTLTAKRDFSKPNTEGIQMDEMYFDGAPYCGSSTPLDNVLFQSPSQIAGEPYGVIEYVRQKEVDGEQIVEIKCSFSTFQDSNPYNIGSEIRLYRDSWVVKEIYTRTMGMTSGNVGWIRASCTYDGITDGIPLIKTYQRFSGEYDKEAKKELTTRQMLCEVTKIVPGPPDLLEFDVLQFLPPGTKLGEISYIRFSTVRIIAIVLGIVFITLGIFFKIQGRRKLSITNS